MLIAGHEVDEHEADRRVLPQQCAERDRRRGLRLVVRCVRDDDARRREHRERGVEVGGERDLHDAIHAVSFGDAEHPFLHVLALAIDELRDACFAHEPRLIMRADGRDDTRTAEPRQLRRVVADCTGRALHEHGLSRDRSVREQAMVRGDGGNSQAGALCERDVLRQRNGLLLGNDRVLRRRPPRALPLCLVDPHALADPRRRHSLADAIDDAGAVLVRNDPRERERGAARSTAPRFDVGRVHARRVDADAYFAGTGLRLSELPRPQDVAGGSLIFVPRSEHRLRSSSFGMGCRRDQSGCRRCGSPQRRFASWSEAVDRGRKAPESAARNGSPLWTTCVGPVGNSSVLTLR